MKASELDAGQLAQQLEDVLQAARRAGADQAEARLGRARTLRTSVRAQQTDELEYAADQSATLTVYCGRRTGSASTTELTAQGLDTALQQALTIARFTEVDDYAGLADADLMAQARPELSLHHPWDVSADTAAELGRRIEAAALDQDTRIQQTEGARVIASEGLSAYGNSHGFVQVTPATQQAISCSAIARDDQGMQHEAAFSQARAAVDLDAPEAIGRLAAQRAVACLGARSVATTTAPVLFVPRAARSLWSHFINAVSGGALYRRASFLQDRLHTAVMADNVTLRQQPHRERGLASAAHDADGVATRERTLVDAGVLQGYVLSAYSGRRLGLATTGNAGGVFNLEVAPGAQDFDALIAAMGRGLVVTQVMGQGVDIVSGDYSRGVSGFWVENGELVHAVENVTIAGNLDDMFRNIEALGADVDTQAALRTPSVCVGGMTIAGH